jgi:hypothetical protein
MRCTTVATPTSSLLYLCAVTNTRYVPVVPNARVWSIITGDGRTEVEKEVNNLSQV